MKKYQALLFTIGLVGASASPILNANAAISTDPTGWDWKWDYDATSGRMEFTDTELTSNGILLPFESYGSGNYSADLPFGWEYTSGKVLPIGIWLYTDYAADADFFFSSPNYYLTTGRSSFGSTSSTTSDLKLLMEFNNPSEHYYYLAFDFSDTTTSSSIFYSYFTASSPAGISNAQPSMGGNTRNTPFARSTTTLDQFFIPPYSKLYIRHNATSTSTIRVSGIFISYGGKLTAFDTGYDNGYDAGFSDGFESADSDALSSFIGIFEGLMVGIAGIMNISVLGSITLGMIAFFPLVGIVILFFKKVVQ